MSDVDSRLRKHLGRRGQLVTLILLILNEIDLQTVPVLELGSDLEELIATTVKLPPELHGDLKRIASLRGSSMTALMNSAIWSHTEMSKKDATTVLKAAHCQLDHLRRAQRAFFIRAPRK
jgi:hypothetical protein